MDIRVAVLSDIDKLVTFVEECEGTYSPLYYSSGEKKYYEDVISKNGAILLAEDDDLLVGYAVLSLGGGIPVKFLNLVGIPEREKDHVAILDLCLVRESHRGKGIQSMFIKKRELLARDRGYRYLCTSTHPDNVFSSSNMLKEGIEIKCELREGPRSPLNYFVKELK